MMKRLVVTMISGSCVVELEPPVQPASAIPLHRALERTSRRSVRTPASACASGTKGRTDSGCRVVGPRRLGAGFDSRRTSFVLEHWTAPAGSSLPSGASRSAPVSDIAAISPHEAWAVWGRLSSGRPDRGER